MTRQELIKEIDTLLIRVGKHYDSASHPAFLITAHRDEILVLIDKYISEVTEGMER